VIVAVVSAVYVSSFAGVLVFDDEPAIASNPHIRRLWPLTESMSAPPDTSVSGRPIVSFTLALNHALAPGDTRDVFSSMGDASPAAGSPILRNLWGYHALNLTVHVLAALALFGIVRRTLQTPRMRDRFGAAATPLALAIALIWAVHPLQTGSVTYVIQRAESLMGLFYLVTLYCAIRATFAPTGRARAWLAAAIIACALGMATKEAMATAPLMVVAWDFVFGGRSDRGGRWPLYTGLAATWIVLEVLVAGGHRTHAVGLGFAEWPWWRYLMTQAGVVVHYLRLSIVPWPLVLDYDWPASRSIGSVAPQALLLVGLLALTVWGLRRRSPAAFAGAWFFVILAPTSSVVPIVTEVAAEHRMYLPLAAVVAVVVLGAYRETIGASPHRSERAALIGGLTVAAVVAALSIATDARNRDYHSYEGIWLDTIQKQPANARARTNYATALLLRRDYAAAEPHLRAAVAAKPEFAEAQADLGVALCARGAIDEGISHLERAIAIQPDYAAAHRDLGEAYAARGDFGAAANAFTRAVSLRPDDVPLLNRLGWILATAREDGVRNGAEAVRLAERAARLSERRDVESLDTVAAAYAETGRFDDATAAGAEALALARQKSETAIIPELEQRLESYRARQRVRQ
jgi:Flp pilus assembly protein TadD